MERGPFLTLLFDPARVFRELADGERTRIRAIQRYLPLLLLLPPACAALGGLVFGWRLGASEPLYLGTAQAVIVSLLYLFALCFGFFSTVGLARWMGVTYGAEGSYRIYVALFTVVCAPLAVASLAHLFPHVFFNVLVMIPAVIWSMALLYRGLPVVLHIPLERGMLMSSALVGWLLVAAVSLLGISAGLWTAGLGRGAPQDHPGGAVFGQYCAACHGPGGEGNPALGAPRLNDAIWLYGGELPAIATSIGQGRNGRMPAFEERLDDLQIRLLVAWLAGDEAAAAAPAP